MMKPASTKKIAENHPRPKLLTPKIERGIRPQFQAPFVVYSVTKTQAAAQLDIFLPRRDGNISSAV